MLGEYTHLKHSESILIKNWARSGESLFSFTVEWPAVPGRGRYDPRILAQTIRQTGLFVAHAEYGVPTSHQTLLHTLEFNVQPRSLDGWARTLGVEVTVTRAQGPAGRGLAMSFRVHGKDGTIARAETEFGWISPAAYRRVRGERATVDWGAWPVPAPVDPGLVGRTHVHDVGLAPGGRPDHWELRNDPGNTLMFDHPVDHVPGLALLDAADQAAQAVLTPHPFEPHHLRIAFARYVEFDRPCRIGATTLTPPGSDRVTVAVSGTQDGETAFQATLSGLLL
ncbi:ScbA/BarX family gamma-butyrolactone biosynthesis protein [Streptomyces sp. JNUCC 64]